MLGRVRQLMIASVLVALLAGGTIFAAADKADASASQCPSGYFCVWEHSPFGGHFAYFSKGSFDLDNPIGGFVFNNKITDVWNRTGTDWCLNDGKNGIGPHKEISSGYQGYTLEFNDRTSSINKVGLGGFC